MLGELLEIVVFFLFLTVIRIISNVSLTQIMGFYGEHGRECSGKV